VKRKKTESVKFHWLSMRTFRRQLGDLAQAWVRTYEQHGTEPALGQEQQGQGQDDRSAAAIISISTLVGAAVLVTLFVLVAWYIRRTKRQQSRSSSLEPIMPRDGQVDGPNNARSQSLSSSLRSLLQRDNIEAARQRFTDALARLSAKIGSGLKTSPFKWSEVETRRFFVIGNEVKRRSAAALQGLNWLTTEKWFGRNNGGKTAVSQRQTWPGRDGPSAGQQEKEEKRAGAGSAKVQQDAADSECSMSTLGQVLYRDTLLPPEPGRFWSTGPGRRNSDAKEKWPRVQVHGGEGSPADHHQQEDVAHHDHDHDHDS
jgi:hypothetical protein